jgi:hypothetical protein
MYQLNVGPTGLNIDLGTSSQSGYSWMADRLMLIVGDTMKLMSRYPAGLDTENAAWLPIAAATGSGWGSASTVTFDDPVPGGWDESSQDIFMYGFVGYEPWACYWQRPTSLSVSGDDSVIAFNNNSSAIPAPSSAQPSFVAMRNMLNVVGKGEYVWRWPTGYLTYRPTDAEAAAWAVAGTRPATYLTLLDTAVRLGEDGNAAHAVNYVTFSGLVFEGTRNYCVQAFGSTELTFSNCTMRNCGHTGWDLEDCTDTVISGGTTIRCTVRGGWFHGGDKATLTQSGNQLINHTVDDIGAYLQANVSAAFEFVKADKTDGCGMLVDGCDFSNCRDGAVGIGGPFTTISDNTFDACCMITGDAGVITGNGKFPYTMTNVEIMIERNTFTNMVRHPRGGTHTSKNPIFTIYWEQTTYSTIQDNIFEDCNHAMNLAGIKYDTIRRNKFTNCHLGHYGAPIVFGQRIDYVQNTRSHQGWAGYEEPFRVLGDLRYWGVDAAPWLTPYPELEDFRAGQPLSDALLRVIDISVVDNMQTNAGAALITVKTWDANGNYQWDAGETGSGFWEEEAGVQCGVDLSQLNYASGSSGTPANGGGNTPLSSLNPAGEPD